MESSFIRVADLFVFWGQSFILTQARGFASDELQAVDRSDVARSFPPQVFLVYRNFKQCQQCQRVYWKGSHLRRLDKLIEHARSAGV